MTGASSENRLTPQDFADRWGRSNLTERASAQPHFIDLCRMLGQRTPTEADTDGDFYAFERRVAKTGSGAGKGFADVWYRGRFAFEYKHKNLAAAYDQLLLYREDLENPPLLVVTDMERFEVHTNFERTRKRVYTFTNADIGDAEPEAMRVLRALFEDPDSLRPGQARESVTEEAARKFARLADGLRERRVDPQEAAHFLNRLLFCLFAEDVGLLPGGLFGEVLRATRRDPGLFERYVGELFGAMVGGGNFLLKPITDRALGYVVGKYAALARVEDVSPHDLRHRFGYEMAKKVPLHRLAQIMGHDSLDTTMVYVRGTQGDLQRAVEEIAWT